MQKFVNDYVIILKNPVNLNINPKSFYETAFNAMDSTEDVNIKEGILTKLIMLYPHDYKLYHIMGTLFRGISVEKELMWYKMSYAIKPDYPENFYAMCKLMLDAGLYNLIYELNKDGLFDKFENDPLFMTTFIRCEFSKFKYKNGLEWLMKLIQINSKTHAVTDHDKKEKWGNYHDAGYIFCSTSDIENAIKYSQKAVDLSIKFDLTLANKLLSFQNLLCYYDYIYEDNEKLFKTYLKINDYLPDTPLFDFNNRKKNSRIRVGYVSSDFVRHTVSNFMLPILRNHNRDHFEIYLFANSEDVGDEYSRLPLVVKKILNVPDKEVATMINNLNIDILFDLNGHTVKNRLGIFSFRPAPIQVTYLGYPNTTGLKTINYRITDIIADSPLSKQRYSEELIRLPKCFLLYDPIHNFAMNPRKTQSKIVLGAINKENKSNPDLLKVWKTILEKCPTASILLKIESYDNKEERTEFYLKHLGVTKDRVIVLNKLSDKEYEKVFTMFDIMLDPFPYSGTTTTCNSLFNSIPVVTLYHPDYHVNNVSSSLLINSGFPELVANTKEEYIDIVVNLVNNPDRLNEYKKSIREGFLNLMDPKKFMNSYESELKKIFEKPFLKPHIEEEQQEKITINISETKPFVYKKKKVYIGCCVRNCANYLDNVFSNIDKIISLFHDYKIIIAHDDSFDNSLDILNKKKTKYNIEILNVSENSYIIDPTLRTKRISNARNAILTKIYDNEEKCYDYFIMMDMDDVNCGRMNIDVLKKCLDNDEEWDSLSFNRKNYFDVWALSLDPYVFSCWHFPGGFDVVNKIKDYVTSKLAKLTNDSLLECMSAFNGFAIYKKDKFVNCNYDWQVRNNYDIIPSDIISKNEKALERKITLDISYHQAVNPVSDCEHRYFHLNAIEKNNARIRISPLCLFVD
jgi:hypothetical protein